MPSHRSIVVSHTDAFGKLIGTTFCLCLGCVQWLLVLGCAKKTLSVDVYLIAKAVCKPTKSPL